MATPSRLRRGEEALSRLALNDLAAMWRQVSNAIEARKMLDEVLPDLVRTYGLAASSMAAEWYDEARLAAEASGAFTAIPADLTGRDASQALSLWATSKGTDLTNIQALVEGGLQRRVYDWSRETVMGSALADPAADGWQRVGVGSCAFCAMLIGRGAVYSESSVQFGSHDHCHCSAAPAFSGAPRPVEPYKPGPRHGSEADFGRAKTWIADHDL